jgi:hypothetical protein
VRLCLCYNKRKNIAMADQPKQPKNEGLTQDPNPTTAPEITDETLLSPVRKAQIDAEMNVTPLPVTAARPSASKSSVAAPIAEPAEKPVADDGADESQGDGNDEPDYNPKADLVDETKADVAEEGQKARGHKHRILGGYWRHKKWTLPLTLLVIVGGLAGVPYTRFLLAGLVIKQSYSVTVIDDATKKPVTSADVRLDGKTVKTDSHGTATLQHVKVGKRELAVSKKYYKSTSQIVLVPIQGKGKQQINIAATGRQVPITVINKLTGKPLENATLKAAGAEVKTDKDGKASIVLPVDKAVLNVTLTGNGYNSLNTKLHVTDQEVKENSYALVPSGKVYFLSRLSGKIDVVKTDLDGGNRQTVVYGTGKEEDRSTVLLASRDWKYLAFYSKRDSSLPKLYLIETDGDKMAPIDEGDASFNLVGWNDHQFVYSLTRNGVKEWEPNRQAVKSYNASKKQLLTMDQSLAEGDQASYQVQNLENFYLIGNKLVYSVRWFGFGNANDSSGKSYSIREAAVDSLSKRDVKSFPAEQYESQQFRLAGPGNLYTAIYSKADKKSVFYEYEGGEVKAADNFDESKFYSATYPTYLASPSDKQAFWSEQRDGRAVFFVGDSAGKNGKQVAALEDNQVYGWYSDDYLLMSKKGSELYILPAAGGSPIKVTDYHKPQISYFGYGGGYGGL